MYSHQQHTLSEGEQLVLILMGKKEKASVSVAQIICFLLSFCAGYQVLRLNSLAKIPSEGLSQRGFVNLPHAVELFLCISY